MVPVSIAGELWFGLFKAVDTEVRRRLALSTNAFDELLIEVLGQGRPDYREYRATASIPTHLNPSSDSHVAIAGLLLGGTSAGDEARHLAAVLDAGLNKVKLKSPAAGMPGFSNDWKLLLGASIGVGAAQKLSCSGDWQAHRSYLLNALDALPQGDITSATMVAFSRKQLGQERAISATSTNAVGLTLVDLISIAWAHHVGLSSPISEDACWAALQERLQGARVVDLGFHELSLLLIVLKDGWASGWAVNRAQGLDFVKATLRDFLPCAKRDIKSELIKSEADVQRIIWTVLRPTFPDLVDEDFLPKFGAKNYKPDFGIPSLRLLIEAKYVSGSKTVAEIQDELHADIIGYRESTSEYSAIIFFVYDTRGEVAANSELHRVIREQQGVADLITVVGPPPTVAAKPRARAR
jgi:hypothetical protein